MPTDTERLDFLERVAGNSYTGISVDRIPSVDGEPSGFRLMRHHFIGPAKKTFRAAIDDAIEASRGGNPWLS